jgi:MtrB/PioB family decaheme-associated outer membrane protein
MRAWSPVPLLFAILLVQPAAAQSPAPRPPSPPGAPAVPPARVGEIDFGLRVSGVSGDPARYQRLRDLRDGPTLDRLRYDRDTAGWKFQAAMDHVGYRDQRYQATFDRYGDVKGSVEWNQIPLFYSADTRTPFRSESPGVFRLDDSLQAAIQNGTATTQLLVPESRLFPLRSRRDIADIRLVYAAKPTLDLKVSFSSARRTGAQPWGASFGQTNAVELAVPVDHRTNEFSAAVEWSNHRAMGKLAYDGSWFTNHVETLIWDNPLRTTDLAAVPAQGRMALWPDSTAHTVSAAGSVALPARSRAFGSVSMGGWFQDQTLLPHTINTAIAAIPLARPTAEAEARILSMNYRVTSRPARPLWLTAQFRLYDYDNRTPHFPVSQYVRVDSGAAASLTGGSEPFGYTRQFVDLDASFTPLPFTAFRVGYGREQDDRTFRLFEVTTDNTVRAAVDSVGLAWGSLRLQYDRAVRKGEGLDEEVFSDIGEQVSLRQFDISDRKRDRLSAIVQAIPINWLGVTASLGVGREHRPDAAFGLRDNDLRALTISIDASPRDVVAMGATYGFERYTTLQHSRQASPGPQFDDPTRDWSTDMDERVHTFTANVNVPHLTARTTLRVDYDYVRSGAQYLYIVPSNSTLVPPQQLSPVRNEIQRASTSVQHMLTTHIALGVGYAYDQYDVDDFALAPGTLDSPVFPTLVSLMYQWRPYTAHTGFARLMYRW